MLIMAIGGNSDYPMISELLVPTFFLYQTRTMYYNILQVSMLAEVLHIRSLSKWTVHLFLILTFIKVEGNSFFSPERGGDVIFRNFRLFCNLKSTSHKLLLLLLLKEQMKHSTDDGKSLETGAKERFDNQVFQTGTFFLLDKVQCRKKLSKTLKKHRAIWQM